MAFAVLGCTTMNPRHTAGDPDSSPDTVIRLAHYQGRLRLVRVHAAGRDWQFLFDTGGGSTLISPEVAAALGCSPRGRITGHRMNGDAIVTPTCPAGSLTIGGWAEPQQTLGVFDLMELLPGDWPRLDGVISLRSFAQRRITLDLASNTLVIHSRGGTGESRAAIPLAGRIATGPSGAELLVFGGVPVGADTLWLEIDSGNLDAVLLAPHSARLLRMPDSAGTENPELVLPFPAGVASRVRARVRDLILDGALNAEWLEGGRLAMDLANGRLWWRGRN